MVSVIVPTRDRPQLLRQALGSVRALEGDDLELDVIVVDNGPGAGSEDVAREFGCRYLTVTARGASVTRNAGLRAARGEFIAFLDDDDVWLPGHLRPHLELMRERPQLAAVLGQVVNSDFELEGRGQPWPDPLPAGRSSFERMFGYMPQLGATVVRASVRDTVGEFDPELLGDQDWDWHLRLAIRHPVDFIAVPCVVYRWWPTADAHRDDLGWSRVPYTERVLWSNVRRAGRSRPPWTTVIRKLLAYRGQATVHFTSSAVEHMARGDRAGARLQLVRALRISPPHCILIWARSRPVGRAVIAALRP
jgi:glycosyltransferase involved in cell wall biosynthesis